MGLIPRSLRSRLLLITLGAVFAVLVLGTIAFNLALSRALDADADRIAEERVESGLERIATSPGGEVSLSGTPRGGRLDSGVWIYSGNELVVGPTNDPRLTAAVAGLIGRPRGFVTIDDPSARLLVVPIEQSGVPIGTVVGGVRLATFESSKRTALIGSLALAAAILLALGFMVWWTLKAALRPVARMTELANRWSTEAPDERFGRTDDRDEIGRLAGTLDALLDRASAGVRRERRLSAEIAHELRTPVSRIAAEAELALDADADNEDEQQALRAIRDEASRIATTISTLVATAESQDAGTRGTASILDVVRAVCHEMTTAPNLPAAAIDTDGVDDLRIGVDADVAVQILRPILENAVRYGAGSVALGARQTEGGVEVSVVDDGPGIDADEEADIFHPGRRGRAGTRSGHAGAGLGLALAQRLAQGADASITADTEAPGGRMLIHFPAG